MTTFLKLAAVNAITLTAVPANDHTVTYARIKSKDAEPFKWIVTLHYLNGTTSFDYSMGVGHVEQFKSGKWVPVSLYGVKPGDAIWSTFGPKLRAAKPELADVLQCLALDAGAINTCFEDWADEYGYDRDSREAEKTYKACIENGRKMRSLLGYSLFTELLQCTEEEDESEVAA